ncbi:RNA polymerase subunit sigma-24 [Streptomyces venezuelae]|uniref:RNA polymerase subunit sigma-24 n=1 Tax=Streptomyces venezuelae TaxID=54571 RepID=A0A5P2AZT4_STRVZ|nr:RNA polymerase subunit sigma-24 [Streptomyces venezuelae]
MYQQKPATGHGSRDGGAHDRELEEAVKRAQQGDEDGFTLAYRLVNPLLIGYLRGLVGEEAEDVCATAWLEIARDLGRFRGDGAGFRAWTVSIARHRALDLLRREKVRPRKSSTALDDLPHPASPDLTDDQALQALATERVLAQLAELPRSQAEAVLLTTIVGLDNPSAARILGKRPGAVRMAVSRGLATLRRRLPLPLTGDRPPSDHPTTPRSADPWRTR